MDARNGSLHWQPSGALILRRIQLQLEYTLTSVPLLSQSPTYLKLWRHKAHGHAMTKMDIVGIIEARKSPGVTKRYHTANVTTAIATTIGTKTPEILSASR